MTVRARLDAARWHFFGYTTVGAKITAAADRLHDKHPESKTVNKIWLFCLPF